MRKVLARIHHSKDLWLTVFLSDSQIGYACNIPICPLAWVAEVYSINCYEAPASFLFTLPFTVRTPIYKERVI